MAENTAAEGGGEAVGMPQLDFTSFPNQIFWLLVALVAIHLILTRVALPRIANVLAERQGTITNDIAQAEELKKKAEEAEAAYEKKLAEARAEAQEIVAEQKAEMQAKLDEENAKADAEIEKELKKSEARVAEIREGALDAIREVSRNAAAEIVQKLAASPEEGAVRAAVDDNMKGLR